MRVRQNGIWRTRPGFSRPWCSLRICPAIARSIRDFNFLFNSYYESVGARHPRPRRGMLTRPPLEDGVRVSPSCRRRDGVSARGDLSPPRRRLIELGCHHEQQHQELLLTDILHLFAQNPLRPAYKDPGPAAVGVADDGPPTMSPSTADSLRSVMTEQGFAFDCEGPRHRVLPRAVSSSPTGW